MSFVSLAIHYTILSVIITKFMSIFIFLNIDFLEMSVLLCCITRALKIDVNICKFKMHFVNWSNT